MKQLTSQPRLDKLFAAVIISTTSTGLPTTVWRSTRLDSTYPIAMCVRVCVLAMSLKTPIHIVLIYHLHQQPIEWDTSTKHLGVELMENFIRSQIDPTSDTKRLFYPSSFKPTLACVLGCISISRHHSNVKKEETGTGRIMNNHRVNPRTAWNSPGPRATKRPWSAGCRLQF